MTLSFIVAVSENNAIGRDNNLPWSLPEDLKFFKRTTMGKPVVMGRKTFEALGRPLPGRLNIVLSHQKDLQLPDGVMLFDNVQDAVKYLENEQTEEAFIIGGGVIFGLALPLADKLYITRVHAQIPDADAFFPDIDHTHWKLTWEENHAADEKHLYAFTFQQYERIEL
jgi:dihydrofolate reductase